MAGPPLTPRQQAIVDSFSEPATKGEVFAARYAVASLVALLHHSGVIDGRRYLAFLRGQAGEGALVGDRTALAQQARLVADFLETPEQAVRSTLKVIEGGAPAHDCALTEAQFTED